MKYLKNITIVFTLLLITLSCENKSQSKDTLENCDTVNNKVLKMTIVVNSDGNYYFTSQGYFTGFNEGNVEYIINDVDVKISELINGNRYKKVDFSKIDLKKNKKVQEQMLAGLTCSCTINGVTVTATYTGNSKSCSDICGEVTEMLGKLNKDNVNN